MTTETPDESVYGGGRSGHFQLGGSPSVVSLTLTEQAVQKLIDAVSNEIMGDFSTSVVRALLEELFVQLGEVGAQIVAAINFIAESLS